MKSPKVNPKRFYFVMQFVVLFSLFVFLVGPKVGYDREGIEHIAILIGIWGPTLGVLGLRAELMQRKEPPPSP